MVAHTQAALLHDRGMLAENLASSTVVYLCQAARRILAGIPTSSQAASLSPYLDAHLFAYDERLITPALRLRTYNEQPLKFVSQRHPSNCRFKVGTCCFGPRQTQSYTINHLEFLLASCDTCTEGQSEGCGACHRCSRSQPRMQRRHQAGL